MKKIKKLITNKKIIIGTTVVLFFVLTLVSSLIILQQNQDIRNQASTNQSYQDLTYMEATVNGGPFYQEITEQSQQIEDGYGIGFKFDAQQGQKLEIRAIEEDSNTNGSYVLTKLYDPNGQLLSSGQTRLNLDVAESGTYKLVVYTWANKVGGVKFLAYEKNKAELMFNAKHSDQLIEIPSDNSSNPLVIPDSAAFSFVIVIPGEYTQIEDQKLKYFNTYKDVEQTIKLEVYRFPQEIALSSYLDNLQDYRVSYHITNLSINTIEIVPEIGVNQLFEQGYIYAIRAEYIYDIPNVKGFTAPHFVSNINNNEETNCDFYDACPEEHVYYQGSCYQNADLNHDGHVNMYDYTMFSSQFSLL